MAREKLDNILVKENHHPPFRDSWNIESQVDIQKYPGLLRK